MLNTPNKKTTAAKFDQVDSHHSFCFPTLYSSRAGYYFEQIPKALKSVNAVYPFLRVARVVNQLLRFEPQLDFILGGFRAIAAMDNVPASCE